MIFGPISHLHSICSIFICLFSQYLRSRYNTKHGCLLVHVCGDVQPLQRPLCVVNAVDNLCSRLRVAHAVLVSFFVSPFGVPIRPESADLLFCFCLSVSSEDPLFLALMLTMTTGVLRPYNSMADFGCSLAVAAQWLHVVKCKLPKLPKLLSQPW